VFSVVIERRASVVPGLGRNTGT